MPVPAGKARPSTDRSRSRSRGSHRDPYGGRPYSNGPPPPGPDGFRGHPPPDYHPYPPPPNGYPAPDGYPGAPPGYYPPPNDGRGYPPLPGWGPPPGGGPPAGYFNQGPPPGMPHGWGPPPGPPPPGWGPPPDARGPPGGFPLDDGFDHGKGKGKGGGKKKGKDGGKTQSPRVVPPPGKGIASQGQAPHNQGKPLIALRDIAATPGAIDNFVESAMSAAEESTLFVRFKKSSPRGLEENAEKTSCFVVKNFVGCVVREPEPLRSFANWCVARLWTEIEEKDRSAGAKLQLLGGPTAASDIMGVDVAQEMADKATELNKIGGRTI